MLPVWVRKMNDDAAYKALTTSNAQGELSALERGMHALHSGLESKKSAEITGRKQQTASDEMRAGRVAEASQSDVGLRPTKVFSHLVEVHPAVKWFWPALGGKLIEEPNLQNSRCRMITREDDMSKLPVILIASALIVSSGMAMAQSTDDNAAPAMTMKKKPTATKDNTDANPAASAEKPAQPGGPSGTGSAAKTNGDTSK